MLHSSRKNPYRRSLFVSHAKLAGPQHPPPQTIYATIRRATLDVDVVVEVVKVDGLTDELVGAAEVDEEEMPEALPGQTPPLSKNVYGLDESAVSLPSTR